MLCRTTKSLSEWKLTFRLCFGTLRSTYSVLCSLCAELGAFSERLGLTKLKVQNYALRAVYSFKKGSEATQTLRAGCSKADPQTDKQTHTNRQGRLQYTAQLSAQCKYLLLLLTALF